MEETEKQLNIRFTVAYTSLKAVRKVKGKVDFAKKLKMPASYYSKFEKFERTIPDYVLDNLEQLFGINKTWVLTGEGKVFEENTLKSLKNEIHGEKKPETKSYPPAAPTAEVEEEEPGHYGIKLFTHGTEKKHELQAIPLYDITASAGLSALYNSSNNILDYLSIPNLPRCDGAINVKGDSMYPLLKHGDIVVFQRLNDILEEIDFGEMYVIDMSTPHLERIYVKYVKKSEKGDDYVTLYSYNEKHHPPKDVKLTKIRAMAAVKASIRLA